jgi:hypothetical protein
MADRLSAFGVSLWLQIWYRFGVMANLAVKEIPDSDYNALKEAARSEARSLNSYVVVLLKSFADERSRRKLMRASRNNFQALVRSLPRMPDSTELIREDRDHAH